MCKLQDKGFVLFEEKNKSKHPLHTCVCTHISMNYGEQKYMEYMMIHCQYKDIVMSE